MDNNSTSLNQASSPVAQASSQSKSAPSHSFSKTEAIKFGLNFFKANISVFVKLALVVVAINIVVGIISGMFDRTPINLLWSLVSFAISIVVQVGFTKIILDLHDGKPLNFSHLYMLYPLALRFLGASILYGFIVAVGLILFIVPGVIWALKFQFYSFLIVDKNIGIMDSLKKSSAMTEGIKMNLFLFAFILVVINIAGALALIIGLFVTIPTTIMATVYVYRKLLSKTPEA